LNSHQIFYNGHRQFLSLFHPDPQHLSVPDSARHWGYHSSALGRSCLGGANGGGSLLSTTQAPHSPSQPSNLGHIFGARGRGGGEED
jgi:hypothetical protein